MLGVGNLIWISLVVWTTCTMQNIRIYLIRRNINLIFMYSDQISQSNLQSQSRLCPQHKKNCAGFQQQIRVRQDTGKWMTISFQNFSRLVQLSAFNWLVPFSSCFPRTLDNSIMAAVPLEASAAPNTQASRWLPSNTSSSMKGQKE